MVQTECVILTQAAAEAGALPMCRAPVESRRFGGEHFAGGRAAGRARWAGAARGPRAIWAARIFAVHTFSVGWNEPPHPSLVTT